MIEINLNKFSKFIQCNQSHIVCYYQLSDDKKLNLDISKTILDFFYDLQKGNVHLKDGYFRCKFACFIDLNSFKYTVFLFPVIRYLQELPAIGKEGLLL